jgi:CMP-N-acetylneuraminic acid synthetase
VIPARGGSKGIPKKNIVDLGGKPLIAHTIEQASQSQLIDRIIVSTDDSKIADISRNRNVEVLMRPKQFANDKASTQDVLKHVVASVKLQGYIPDAVVTLQPTSPLRRTYHINEAVSLFLRDDNADSLVSCVMVPHIYHPLSVMKITANGYLVPFQGTASRPMRRQDKSSVYARNGAAIYITRASRLTEYIFGGRLIPYMMDEFFSIDIDSYEDLFEAERRLIDLNKVMI